MERLIEFEEEPGCMTVYIDEGGDVRVPPQPGVNVLLDGTVALTANVARELVQQVMAATELEQEGRVRQLAAGRGLELRATRPGSPGADVFPYRLFHTGGDLAGTSAAAGSLDHLEAWLQPGEEDD